MTGILLSGLMLSVTTWVVFICSGLPFTVSWIPFGLPITIDTGCFSSQVIVWPAGMMPW